MSQTIKTTPAPDEKKSEKLVTPTVRGNENTTNNTSITTTPYNRDRGNFYKKRNSFFKKECFFKKNHIDFIDFKDIELLKRFVRKTGQIIPKRITGTSIVFQKKLNKAIKRARYMGLLPFTGEISGFGFPDKKRLYPKKNFDKGRPDEVRESRESLNNANNTSKTQVEETNNPPKEDK